MQLRIAEQAWQRLRAQLFARTDVESAGLLLAEPLPSPSGTVFAVRRAFAVDDEVYRTRLPDRISLDPVALNRLMRPARDQGWSVFTIHTHPGASEPWFSAADDAGDARLMPSLACRIPDTHHGSIVIVDDGQAIARVFDEAGLARLIPVQVVGRTIERLEPVAARSEPWFARQELALGPRGQAQLRRLRVGVVGLGGIGSLVSMQLAHLGVGALVLLDGDLIEASNVSRIAGATKDDIGSPKVYVAARYARSLNLVENIEAQTAFLAAEHAALLGGCDVIVSCVDRHTPRAILNRTAYDYLVPTIDLGTAFRVDSAGTIIGDAGRVVVVGPDKPCLACWGHLDADALRNEALSEDQREEQIEAGYIQGAVVSQPSVIAFNAFVAGAGVVELLRLATSFAGADTPPLRLAFSFASGTVRRNALAAGGPCLVCGNESRIAEATANNAAAQ